MMARDAITTRQRLFAAALHMAMRKAVGGGEAGFAGFILLASRLLIWLGVSGVLAVAGHDQKVGL